MKKLNTCLLRLNKKHIFLLGVLFFTLSCNDPKLNKNEISVSVIKKEKLDKNSLMLTILFKNTSDKNYAFSVFPEYYLVKTKSGLIGYEDVGKIKGKIVSSDFADQMEDWEKGSMLLNTFYRKTGYDYKEADKQLFNFAMHDSESYSSYILLLPKKSERKMIICFNSYKVNNKTLFDKKSRISANWEFFEPRAKILDSLLKKEKINYHVYDKNPFLKDSLFINK